MAALSDFTTDVLADLPGCPTPYANRVIRRVIRDFCKRTHCYQADLTDISVVASTQSYTLTDPSNTEIIALTKVQEAASTDTRVFKLPYTAYFFDPPTFTLHDNPTSAFTLEVRAALRPNTTTTTIDDIIYDNYYEAIVSGAKSWLMLETSKPWSNPQAGMLHAKIYETQVRRAKNDLSKEFSNKDQRIKMINWV